MSVEAPDLEGDSEYIVLDHYVKVEVIDKPVNSCHGSYKVDYNFVEEPYHEDGHQEDEVEDPLDKMEEDEDPLVKPSKIRYNLKSTAPGFEQVFETENDNHLTVNSSKTRRPTQKPIRYRTTVCTKCSSGFVTSELFEHHMRTVHGDDNRLIKCRHCDKVFTQNNHLKQHLKASHHFSCEICGKSYERRKVLDQHRLKVHNVRKSGFKITHQDKVVKVPPHLYQFLNPASSTVITSNDGIKCDPKRSSVLKLTPISELEWSQVLEGRGRPPLKPMKEKISWKTFISPFQCRFCELRFRKKITCNLHESKYHINGKGRYNHRKKNRKSPLKKKVPKQELTINKGESSETSLNGGEELERRKPGRPRGSFKKNNFGVINVKCSEMGSLEGEASKVPRKSGRRRKPKLQFGECPKPEVFEQENGPNTDNYLVPEKTPGFGEAALVRKATSGLMISGDKIKRKRGRSRKSENLQILGSQDGGPSSFEQNDIVIVKEEPLIFRFEGGDQLAKVININII